MRYANPHYLRDCPFTQLSDYQSFPYSPRGVFALGKTSKTLIINELGGEAFRVKQDRERVREGRGIVKNCYICVHL